MFGVSKKVFKQAIGALFKQKQIDLDKQSIRLL
jgi:predicted RNA-binding protein (virulence factor B family)